MKVLKSGGADEVKKGQQVEHRLSQDDMEL